MRNKRLKIVFVLMLTLLLLLGLSGTALADTAGPTPVVKPAPGSTITSALGDADKIWIHATDPDEIDALSIRLTADNDPAQLPFSVIYDTDYWGGEDYTSAYILGPRLADGPHTLHLTIKDKLGNTTVYNWSFTVAIHPDITNITPPDKYVVSTGSVNISANISDANLGVIDTSSISVMIDGLAVPYTYTPTDPNNGILTAVISGLSVERDYTLQIGVADMARNFNYATWTVYYNPYGEMSAARASDCSSCHRLNSYNKYIHKKGPDLETTGGTAYHGQSGTCGHCHYSIYVPEKCDYCHNGEPMDVYNGIVPANPSLQADRSCLDCHGVTGPMAVKVNNSVYAAPAGTKHDILPLHKTSIPSDCTNCHSPYLTRTHNRNNRSGQPMDCNTCHKSTSSRVIEAIADHNKDCGACHEGAGHQPQHAGTLDQRCQGCHNLNLITEHKNRSINCFGCHSSREKEHKRTIAAGSLYCAGCHQTGHGFVFADKVPADIVLYPGFIWTTPQEASLFAGETTTPIDYENGQVIISNRRTDVSIENLWNTYNNNFAAKEWVLKSDPPQPGTTGFTAVFNKGNRYITLKCYSTVTSNSTELSAAGCRTEIWYK